MLIELNKVELVLILFGIVLQIFYRKALKELQQQKLLLNEVHTYLLTRETKFKDLLIGTGCDCPATTERLILECKFEQVVKYKRQFEQNILYKDYYNSEEYQQERDWCDDY